MSKSIDQSAGLPEPVNPVDPSLSRGLSAFDLRHNFVASLPLRLSTAQASANNSGIRRSWALAGIARFTTGLPVTLLNNNDTSLLGTIPNGINNNGVDTPEWSGKTLHINTNPRGGAAVFDASQFSLPALGTMGNARRRFFSGPGWKILDATLSREFSSARGPRPRVSRRSVQRLQSRAVLRACIGRGQHFQRHLRPGGERDAAAADADGGAVAILDGANRGWGCERALAGLLKIDLSGLAQENREELVMKTRLLLPVFVAAAAMIRCRGANRDRHGPRSPAYRTSPCIPPIPRLPSTITRRSWAR